MGLIKFGKKKEKMVWEKVLVCEAFGGESESEWGGEDFVMVKGICDRLSLVIVGSDSEPHFGPTIPSHPLLHTFFFYSYSFHTYIHIYSIIQIILFIPADYLFFLFSRF